MPELPEVETVRRGLAAILPGKRIVEVMLNRADLRTPFPKDMRKRLVDQRFGKIERRSKYLLLHLHGGDVLISHLGMSGSWIARKSGEGESKKHDHVILRLDDDTEIVYHDPRRFGLLHITRESELSGDPLLKNLGPEPRSKAFSPKYLSEVLSRRKGPVKPALMDAALVVGVGNIYACEALFRAGLHPATLAPVAAKEAAALVPAIQAVLKEAIESGGSTLRDYRDATGKGGYFQHFFYAYGRKGKPCRKCETPIEKIVMAGRGTFFCPHCQTSPSRRNKSLRKSVPSLKQKAK